MGKRDSSIEPASILHNTTWRRGFTANAVGMWTWMGKTTLKISANGRSSPLNLPNRIPATESRLGWSDSTWGNWVWGWSDKCGGSPCASAEFQQVWISQGSRGMGCAGGDSSGAWLKSGQENLISFKRIFFVTLLIMKLPQQLTVDYWLKFQLSSDSLVFTL